jgi:hypothetical protein
MQRKLSSLPISKDPPTLVLMRAKRSRTPLKTIQAFNTIQMLGLSARGTKK